MFSFPRWQLHCTIDVKEIGKHLHRTLEKRKKTYWRCIYSDVVRFHVFSFQWLTLHCTLDVNKVDNELTVKYQTAHWKQIYRDVVRWFHAFYHFFIAYHSTFWKLRKTTYIKILDTALAANTRKYPMVSSVLSIKYILEDRIGYNLTEKLLYTVLKRNIYRSYTVSSVTILVETIPVHFNNQWKSYT